MRYLQIFKYYYYYNELCPNKEPCPNKELCPFLQILQTAPLNNKIVKTTYSVITRSQ